MTEAEESAARAAFRALPSNVGTPQCIRCRGAGRTFRRVWGGGYDADPCTACNGRGVVGVP